MREPTEMELRVAKAINPHCHWDGFPSNADDIDRERFQATMDVALWRARDSIRAMREPTNAMLEDAGPVENWGAETGCDQYADEMHRDWWRSMIDVASPP